MRNASPWRWLLLFAGLAAMSGCAQLPGGTAYAPIQLDQRLAAERYLAPASNRHRVAQTRARDRVWAKMGTKRHTASAPAVVAASPEEPADTSTVQTSTLQPPSGPPAGAASDPNRPRTLWDKQPWEVELDKKVRGICRGC